LTEGILGPRELLAALVISLPKTQPQAPTGIFMRPPKHLDIEAGNAVCSGKGKSWVMEQKNLR
jgi:hypothetical protein